MKRINNPLLLSEYIEKHKIDTLFSVCKPEMMLFQYSEGELLTNPFSPSDYIQFVVDGRLLMYDMPDEESTIMLQPSFGDLAILGEMEFLDSQFVPFFVEASSDVYTIAISLEQYRDRLLEDPAFLRHLCRSLAKKLAGAVNASNTMPLKRRIALLIHNSPSEYITDIGKTARMMNVSNRQILRVLKQFCKEGVLEHEGRGKYRILTRGQL